MFIAKSEVISRGFTKRSVKGIGARVRVCQYLEPLVFEEFNGKMKGFGIEVVRMG